MTEETPNRPGRNDPCHCGSGKKYKHCCLVKDEEADRLEREKAAAEAAPAASEDESEEVGKPQRHEHPQPWKKGTQNTRGFQKFTAPRKVGGS